MGLDDQLERMRVLYAEKSDAELKALFGQRDDLMPVAQQALEQTMQQRGLSPQERALHDAAPGQPDADALDALGLDALGQGEALVYLFHDAFEAREAMRHLSAAEIDYRMLDWHTVDPKRPVSSTGVDLGLVTQQAEVIRARTILQQKLDLFPGTEVDVAPVDGEPEPMVVLSMFERADALVAAQALGVAGISYLWRDGRDAGAGLPDAETVAIEVGATVVEQAALVVDEALAG
jgi:hypothetical protein